MEALRQAIQRALEQGDLLPDQELKDLLDGTPEQMDAKMKEMIDQLIDRLMEEGYITGQPQITDAAGQNAARASRARAASATAKTKRALKSRTRPSIFWDSKRSRI